MIHILVSLALLHLALLFATAGISKALAPDGFAQLIRSHGVIPPSASKAVALATIGIEIGLGIWLIGGVQYRLATSVALVMLTAFFVYHLALKRTAPSDTDCGCMGTAGYKSSTAGLVMNIVVAGSLALTGSGNHYDPRVAIFLASLAIVVLALAFRRNVHRWSRSIGSVGSHSAIGPELR